MNKLKNIVKFYRDCYQTDLKGVRIRNFVSNQCESRFIPRNNEFFHDNYQGFPIDTEWAKTVDQNLFLNGKEKTLYAGSIFIMGQQNTIGKKKNALTPLYIHELELAQLDEVYFLSIKETFFNPDFIELANNADASLNLSFDALTNEAPANPIGFGNQVLLNEFFKKHIKSWNISELTKLQNPDFNHDEYYKDSIKNKTRSHQILPFLMFGVFKKPKGSLGVLNELNLLAENISDSKILNQFFQLEEIEIQAIERRDIYLPTTLSEKQESAFYGTDTYPITQIIGPPGTGKSYTISALAIDAISNNQSVLIVTRNIQASRVITNIIESQFGIKGTIIKAYNQVYKRSLLAKLSKAIKMDSLRQTSPKKLAKRVRKILDQIHQIEKKIIDNGNKEYQWGEFYSQNQEDFFSIFKDQWFQYQKRTTKPIWRLNTELKELRKEKSRLVKKYIKIKVEYDLIQLVREKKLEFLKLNHALRDSNLTSFDKKINKVDYELILKAVPLWTSTTKEISKCLPLTSGLFDIVIFDESSQCDIASVIPSIYRAKKMIVVGDPHQLRHISFLSAKKQLALRKSNSVSMSLPDYRNESLIDWTNSSLSNPDQTTYLDEHFRSKPDLIQFSNRKFYDNELKLIRSNPISDRFSSLKIVQSEGERDVKGVNVIEVNQLFEVVREIIAQHSKSHALIAPKIGISSPFTEQVKLLKKSLAEAVPFHQVKKHDILIGTPFHFQGEERDIMLISFCVDRNSHPASINYLNRKDVFNVLVTRARNKQIIFTSILPSLLPEKSLLKEYIESNYYQASSSKAQSQSMIYDEFYEEVSEYLKDSGYELIKHSTIVSGIVIDMVVVHDEKYYCIDLIGYPGDYEDQFSLEDLRILNRVDVPLFFLPYSSWYIEKEKSKRNLLSFIQNENKK